MILGNIRELDQTINPNLVWVLLEGNCKNSKIIDDLAVTVFELYRKIKRRGYPHEEYGCSKKKKDISNDHVLQSNFLRTKIGLLFC